jgi:uncharacterized linocin/CFP29 family protein
LESFLKGVEAMDFILNGQATGDVASRLLAHNMDPNCLRPYIGTDGRSYMTVMDNGKPTAVPLMNTTATLRKDDWKILDEAIVKAAKPRLRAVADVRAAGLTYTIPNGMGKTALETETQSDISDAIVSMDGLRESQADRPVFELSNLPLPIIHKDFNFSLRQIMTSRNGGSPIDTTTAELAGRKVAEMAEKLLIGTETGTTYGGGIIYGLMNYINRQTKTITSPVASGWTAATTLAEVLNMKHLSQVASHYGPWMLYCSTAWDEYMDNDYVAAAPQNTLRMRLRMIEGIQDVRTLDYLTGYTLLLVQMTSDTVREVIGMDISTVQWETKGGMQVNFKVMAIMVPQVRCDQSGNCGIVHGSV